MLDFVGRGSDGGCLLCARARARNWHQAHPGFAAARSRKSRKLHPIRGAKYRNRMYKLTPEVYDSMLVAQNHKCRICRGVFDLGNKLTIPCVDHDHACCPKQATCGKCIRGVICYACNSVLGFAKDSTQTLYEAIQYLKETQIGKQRVRSKNAQ
jgi:hypothetical protein